MTKRGEEARLCPQASEPRLLLFVSSGPSGGPEVAFKNILPYGFRKVMPQQLATRTGQ